MDNIKKNVNCKFCTPQDTCVDGDGDFANILTEAFVPAGALGEFANEVWHTKKSGKHYIEYMLCNRSTDENIAPVAYEITYCPVCGRKFAD